MTTGPSPDPAVDQVVIGVAIPVPEPWGTHLQRLRIGYGEARAARIPTHITLLPPTPVGPGVVDDLSGHLARVSAAEAPFEILLRGTGTFRPVSDVVFIQVAKGVATCERLEQQVRSGPVHRTLDFPYHPHVTLAHDVPGPALDRAFADFAAFGCSFTADVVRLYVHEGDGLWRTHADHPLTAR